MWLVFAELSTIFNQRRQEVFSYFHPIGEAKQIEVHDAEMFQGEAGQPILCIRYTIYWKGPVTADGFTKVATVYDLESKRTTNTDILATNGITKAQALQFGLEFATGYLQEVARQETYRQEVRQQFQQGGR